MKTSGVHRITFCNEKNSINLENKSRDTTENWIFALWNVWRELKKMLDSSRRMITYQRGLRNHLASKLEIHVRGHRMRSCYQGNEST